jgi:MbtH protein
MTSCEARRAGSPAPVAGLGENHDQPIRRRKRHLVVLVNQEGQYSLWPALVDVPDGWSVIHPADSRKACLDFINSNWTDMRPKSLRSVGNGGVGQ